MQLFCLRYRTRIVYRNKNRRGNRENAVLRAREKAKAVVYNRMLAGNRGGKILSVVYGWADMYYVAEYEDGKEILAPVAMKKNEVEALISKNGDRLLMTDERSHATFGGELADECECMRIAAENADYIDGDELEPLYAMLSQAERELKK